MFYLSKLNQSILNFSLCGANILSMLWQFVLLLSKFGLFSNSLSFGFLMLWTISIVSLMWCFVNVISFETSLSFWLLPLSLFVKKFICTEFLRLLQNLLNGYTVNISTASCFFYNSIYVGFKFHFLAAHSSLLASFLFWLSIVVKCHLSLPLEARNQHNYIICHVCVNRITDVQWPITTDFEKINVIKSLVMITSVFLRPDLCTEELTGKLGYAITYSWW